MSLYTRFRINKELRVENGRAMAQAVSHRPLTAATRVRARAFRCGICGVQSGTGTGFSPIYSVSPVSIVPPPSILIDLYHPGGEQYVR
jgi:hypothetical protein